MYMYSKCSTGSNPVKQERHKKEEDKSHSSAYSKLFKYIIQENVFNLLLSFTVINPKKGSLARGFTYCYKTNV
jgi:hypothetical protein